MGNAKFAIDLMEIVIVNSNDISIFVLSTNPRDQEVAKTTNNARDKELALFLYYGSVGEQKIVIVARSMRLLIL